MKKFILPFLLLLCQISYAQTHQFFYECEFKLDSLSENTEKLSFVLDVNNDNTKFYNYDFYYNDSINLKNRYDQDTYNYTYANLKIRLKKDKNKEDYINFVNQTPNYYSYKTKAVQNWAVQSETKKIGDFKVQKATTNFGGREWIAWFAPDIPIMEGPYKFNNLPGLILEVYDTKGNYSFRLTGSRKLDKEYNTEHFLENENQQKPIPITEKQWEKLQLDYYQNPLKDFDDSGLIIEDENGNMKEVDARELTLKIQKSLKEENNPIELDKAILYP